MSGDDHKHICAEVCSGEFRCALCQELVGNFRGASDDTPELCDDCAVKCVYCGKQPTEGNYTIERDGMLLGYDVPLCDACGGEETPTCEQIWLRINENYGTFADYGEESPRMKAFSEGIGAAASPTGETGGSSE